MSTMPQKAVFGMAYLGAHLVCGTICWLAILILPLLAFLVLAVVSGDPGGPLFWPVAFVMLLVVGIVTAAVLSLVVFLVDLLRMKWRFPVWLAPMVGFVLLVSLFSFIPLPGYSLRGPAGLALIFTVAFTGYWLAVSLLWKIPYSLWGLSEWVSGKLSILWANSSRNKRS